MKNESIQAQEFELFGGRLFVAPTQAKDVVSVEGSVLGGPNFYAHKNEILPVIASELLDAGTAGKPKETLRNSLAARGISLSFGVEGDRTVFSGHCFPEDLPLLLNTIAECLGQATFPEKEVKAEKARELGRIAEEKSDTNAVARIVLSRLMYDPTHIHFEETLESLEKQTKRVSRAGLLSLRKQFGTKGLILAVTGDVTEGMVRATAEKAFRKLEAGSLEPLSKKPNTKSPAAGEKKIFIADKANIDVYLGASVPLTKKDSLYHPLVIVADMLGGGFAAHLMQTVRERDGLTYRTYARASGFNGGADGFFLAYASFNPGRYEESVEKLRKEINVFFTAGITENALVAKKEEIVGSYLVSLSTSRGLAQALHQLAADGRPLSYLTEYPEIIKKVTLAETHRAADLIPLTKLSLAASGTFSKK